MKNLHPLAKYFLPLGIGLLVISVLWWLFQPLAHYLGSFWLQLAIAIIIGLLIWRFALGQMEKVWAFFTMQPIRGILTAAILTAIYGGAAWAAYQYLFPILIRETGVDPRFIVLLLGLASIFAVPAIWYLYGPVGLPGDPITIRRGLMGLLLAATIVVGWWTYNQPSFFFDPQSGKVRFWIAEKEEQVYFHPGKSPATGETLVPGSTEAAIKHKRRPWSTRIWEWWHSTSFQSSRHRTSAPAPRIIRTFHVPAGQTVATGIWMRQGKVARFSQPVPKLYFLKGNRYDVPVRSAEWADQWKSAGQIGLRGGSVDTTVTVTING